jgi:tetratricopeptide (TPR) repeat protein
VHLDPNIARVIVFSWHGHWKEAAAFSRLLYELFPGNPQSAFRRGPLLLKIGEIEAYETLCREIVTPFAAATNDQLEAMLDSVIKDYSVHGLSYIAKVICLRSPTAEHLKCAVILADRAVALKSEPYRNWLLLTQALTQYRGGEYPKAISNLEPLIPQLPPAGKASAKAVLAMARYQMNEGQAAEKSLNEGEALFNAHWFSETRVTLKDEGDPHDWLIADILLREAKELVTQ